ncbi:MAG TPA: response regulator transcription factor [Polyangiaceae bacterium]
MKVLLVDDHKIIRDGLHAILDEQPGIDVVGEAADGHEALALAQTLRPEVVVMDVSMEGLNGIDATARLACEHPGIKVIGLSMNADRRYVLAMLSAGAAGYLWKNAAADELIRAIQAVAAGRTYLSPEISGVVIETAVNASLPAQVATASTLSPREREVLQLLAEGRTSKDIALTLHIGVPTVETHRRQIMGKLKLRSIAELTKYAIREGLTPLG